MTNQKPNITKRILYIDSKITDSLGEFLDDIKLDRNLNVEVNLEIQPELGYLYLQNHRKDVDLVISQTYFAGIGGKVTLDCHRKPVEMRGGKLIGFDYYKIIKEKWPNLPFILVGKYFTEFEAEKQTCEMLKTNMKKGDTFFNENEHDQNEFTKFLSIVKQYLNIHQ